MLKLGTKGKGILTWDESGKSEVVQILISHEQDKINSIQFVYVVNGNVHHSEIHGKADGSKFDMVTLDYPSEFLTSVSGEHGSCTLASTAFGTKQGNYGSSLFGYPSEFPTSVSGEHGSYTLASIAFGTNKGIYGPFGRVNTGSLSKSLFVNEREPTTYEKFSYKFGPRSCFAGFHGTINKDSYVSTIGIYVKPIESLLELADEK